MLAHIDADSFFASVLQRKHPQLRGKPLLALGMGGGCVIAASYEAKATGVRTGMPLREAMKLCPKAVHMPADFAETTLASKQIEAIIQSHCPIIEQYSIDEWFLDLQTCVGGIPFDLLLWGKDIQKEILQMTDLSVSIGIAPSKILAKTAGEEKKPAGCTVIEKHEIEAFLMRRPVMAIPGIGRKRGIHAQARKWETAWDFATADCTIVQKLFGIGGRELQRELLGERVYNVESESSAQKSISRARSFKMTDDRQRIWAQAMQHISYCVLKMRTQETMARGIGLWLRDHQFHHDGLQLKLPQAMDTEEDITPYVRKAFDTLIFRMPRCTQIGFSLWNLVPKAAAQFSLFESPTHAIEDEHLQDSMDRLRKKYGREVVLRGSALAVHKQKMRELDFSVFE